jgi:tagatose 1,6-diphosphate aldolase
MELLTDGEITLRLIKDTPAEPERLRVRALRYDIVAPESSEPAGYIDFRLGYTLSLVRHGGNIGYGVNAEYRGRHLAGKACKLIGALAKSQGMDVLWVTCTPENVASRKTCEWIGASFVEIVDLPPDHDCYLRGDRQVCRYRWILY